MTRVKSLSARKHRKIKKEAKGFKHARRKRVKTAKEALLHSGQYAYIGRRLKKRDLRRLWTIRINAAARNEGLSYSKFIHALKKNKVEIDRKILADIAVRNTYTFKKIVDAVK